MDVFFVISGYLITRILIDEIVEDRFSLLAFYERRARRILPALFAVLLACVPFAWVWLLDDQLVTFAESLGAVLLFLSNIYFLSEVGYFAPEAELQPLLHTWSLGVEEQYYLAFPLITMLALQRGLPRLLPVLVVLSLASLAVAIAGAHLNAERSFFFTLSRLWELGVGSICAVVAVHLRPGLNGPLAMAGVAMIGTGMLAYDNQVPLADLMVLLPVGGAALVVIFGQTGTLAARLLSQPLLVGIGLVSYSAYLVHQPLFAFARIRSPEEPGYALMAGLAVASLGLGWLLWRFVERPFRGARPQLLPDRRVFFATCCLVASILMAVALTFRAGDGFPQRMQQRYAGDIGHAAFFAPVKARYAPCAQPKLLAASPRFEDIARCFQSHASGPVTIALVGDSHAEHLFPGVADRRMDDVVAIYLQDRKAPFLDAPGMPAIFDELAANDDLRVVVFAMHWARRFPAAKDEAQFEEGLRQTLAYLAGLGVPVLVAGDLPWFVSDPAACKYEVFPGNLRYCEAERPTFLKRRPQYLALLDRVAAETGVTVVPLRDLFCSDEGCSMVRDGTILFGDSNHLNLSGSALAGARVAEAIQAALP